MLEIKPIQTKQEQESICKACNMKFITELFCYAAFDNGNLEAACQFKIDDTVGRIYYTKMHRNISRDMEALFLLNRAVLNFLDICTVESAVYNITDKESEFIAIHTGFKKINGEYCIEKIHDIFTDGCYKGYGYNQLN